MNSRQRRVERRERERASKLVTYQTEIMGNPTLKKEAHPYYLAADFLHENPHEKSVLQCNTPSPLPWYRRIYNGIVGFVFDFLSLLTKIWR